MKAIMDEDGEKRVIKKFDSTMMVRIQSYEGRIPSGIFVSAYSDKEYKFQGLDQMFLIMEDIMDSVSMPWPFLGHRSLYEKEEPYVFCETKTEGRTENIPRFPGDRATFVIRVYYRQHGSMQGELIADEGKRQKRVAFRSVLELMRLLYEYLDTELGDG